MATKTEKIKTFEEACAALDLTAEGIIKNYSSDVLAFKKITVIVEALNDGWKPNWADSSEPKYYPWFYNGGSGFSFSCVNYRYYGRSYLGSRLCFKNEKLAEYAGRQFEALYNEYFSSI